MIFVPAGVFIIAYATVQWVGDALSAAWDIAIPYGLVSLLTIGEIVTLVLLCRWWRTLHEPAKGGAIVVLAIGAALCTCIFGVSLGFLRL